MRTWVLILSSILSPVAFADETSSASNRPVPIESQIGLDSKLGAMIPHGLFFRDETGKRVALDSYFGKRPVLMSLVYYGCPSLCGMVMSGLFRGVASMGLTPGQDFEMLFVSIDPLETSKLAAAKKANYLKNYVPTAKPDSIHFLVGEQAAITELAERVGFRYVYDAKTKQYAHPGAAMVLTPDGKMSRYHAGVDFPSKDLRLSLVDASEKKIGTWVDKFLLYCYHYDPTSGRYGLAIFRALRALSLLTVVAVGVGVFIMKSRERTA
jgi:protein SCO1